MVKDHRTGYEEGNPDAVFDGKLDGFIDAMKSRQQERG
jgi:peptide chain release factor 2